MITVQEEEPVIPVKSVTLDPATKTLIPGKTVRLKAVVTPGNATYSKLSWSSSNKKIAKVDDNGKVTAVAPGTAKITVKAGGKSAKATVKVADMQLGTDRLVIKQGGSKAVSGTFVNDKFKTAKVTKDKNKVIDKVEVDKTGKKITVKTKKKNGEATVKVTSAAGIKNGKLVVKGKQKGGSDITVKVGNVKRRSRSM